MYFRINFQTPYLGGTRIMDYWLVHTNNTEEGTPNAFKYILRQGVVATFYDKKGAVEKLEVGDIVLLYHGSNQIIGVGAVVQTYEPHDIKRIDNITHQADVNWIWKAHFDDECNPKNPIMRDSIENQNDKWSGLMAVENVTGKIRCRSLLEQIAKKQEYYL